MSSPTCLVSRSQILTHIDPLVLHRAELLKAEGVPVPPVPDGVTIRSLATPEEFMAAGITQTIGHAHLPQIIKIGFGRRYARDIAEIWHRGADVPDWLDPDQPPNLTLDLTPYLTLDLTSEGATCV